MSEQELPEPERTPVGWLETVTLAGSEVPVRVVLDGRDGHQVFLRQADPSDGEVPRVPLFEGDEPVVMTALSHASYHSTEEVGRIDDMLTSVRIVPVRREPGRVYARTLRLGEVDVGNRVHVRPGDDLTFEEGSVTVELEAIDAAESEGVEGYVPLTPVHPDALTIFDYQELLSHSRITYGTHSLDLANDVPKLIAAARGFLKDVALRTLDEGWY